MVLSLLVPLILTVFDTLNGRRLGIEGLKLMLLRYLLWHRGSRSLDLLIVHLNVFLEAAEGHKND